MKSKIKINFKLDNDLHERYNKLKKKDKKITIESIVKKGLNDALIKFQDKIDKSQPK